MRCMSVTKNVIRISPPPLCGEGSARTLDQINNIIGIVENEGMMRTHFAFWNQNAGTRL